MATSHSRIQVTEDPELARALQAVAPHLPPGLSRSRQVRELAIVGAERLLEGPQSEDERQESLDQLATHFERPQSAPWDWDALRDVKRLAWRLA